MSGDVAIGFVLVVLAFIVSVWLTRWLCDPESRLYRLDHPNSRSLHENPTPRAGGLAILAAIIISGSLVVVSLSGGAEVLWIAAAGLLVAGISFADDWFGLSRSYRLIVHFAGAGLLVWLGLGVTSIALPGSTWALSGALATGVSLVFVVWMVNLYNFMDGMDGFAGGMATIGFGCFALFGWLEGELLFAALNLVVAAAASGFLLSNFPPARIFMGDVGSSMLGFLAATSMLWADRDGIFPLWIGVLVFSVFIVDATVTLIMRILKRERFLEAHKNHYYQRLVQLGWGHRRTVLWEYAVIALCALSALLARCLSASGQWIIIVIWLSGYALIMFAVSQLEARKGAVLSR